MDPGEASCGKDDQQRGGEPVVIVKELDKDGKMGTGKVTLSPKAKMDDYGKCESILLTKSSNLMHFRLYSAHLS